MHKPTHQYIFTGHKHLPCELHPQTPTLISQETTHLVLPAAQRRLSIRYPWGSFWRRVDGRSTLKGVAVFQDVCGSAIILLRGGSQLGPLGHVTQGTIAHSSELRHHFGQSLLRGVMVRVLIYHCPCIYYFVNTSRDTQDSICYPFRVFYKDSAVLLNNP